MDAPVERRACLRQLLGLGAIGLSGCASPRIQGPADSSEGVPAFSASPMGSTQPTGWLPYVIRRDKAATQYTIVPGNDRPVLHARSSAAASGMRCAVRIDPHRAAQLRFSWRVQQISSPPAVDTPERDDSPARVILAFDGDHAKLSLRDRLLFDQVELFTGHRVPYATLMYVWDGTLPPETVVHNHRTSRVRYLTVESGAGRWLHYERNVVADFQRAFGEAPGLITSVGVLTDSDATKHDFQTWYGDISLSRRRGA
ncbi:MAG TPA: DUF3047 domain-containing protein [Aquabacterium sp.]|nr:DUF3047 domain-containing protein [Aquabacterium sp.]